MFLKTLFAAWLVFVEQLRAFHCVIFVDAFLALFERNTLIVTGCMNLAKSLSLLMSFVSRLRARKFYANKNSLASF